MRSSVFLLAIAAHQLLVTLGTSTTEIKTGIYIRSRLNLTEFPTDILFNATLIDLSDNSLKHIQTTTQYDFIDSLFLDWNDISEFPDLVNVSGSLRVLSLRDNKLLKLRGGFYKPFIKTLEVIDLSFNFLRGFPTSNYVKLHTVIIDNNKYRKIPSMPHIIDQVVNLSVANNGPKLELAFSEMIKMKSLLTINMSNSTVLHAPNFCHLPQIKYGDFSMNDFTCGCEVKWMLWAHQCNGPDKLNINADELRCLSPDNSQPRIISQLDARQLECTDTYVERRFRRVEPSHMSCNIPKVSRTTLTRGNLHCALLCQSEPLCMVFGTAFVSTVTTYLTHLCLITDFTQGSDALVNKDNVQWHAVI